MENIFDRQIILIGKDNQKKLLKKRIAVFGLGGVGGHCAEALVRAGIGHLTLIDFDTISVTNLNRQIIATTKNIGELKVTEAKKRFMDINPEVHIDTYPVKFLPENSDLIDFSQFDFVIDAIDNVKGKLEIIKKAKDNNIPVISSMGTANKLNPADLRIGDVFETNTCPLAKIMRHDLRKLGITNLKCVYSVEPAIKPDYSQVEYIEGNPCGSVSFVPSVAGLILASEIIKDLIK